MTWIDEAVAEKCPLTDSYQIISQKLASNHQKTNYLSLDSILENELKSHNKNFYKNNNCIKNIESNVITKCDDNTMLRLDFQECLSVQSNINQESSNNNNNNNYNKPHEMFESGEKIAPKIYSNQGTRFNSTLHKKSHKAQNKEIIEENGKNNLNTKNSNLHQTNLRHTYFEIWFQIKV